MPLWEGPTTKKRSSNAKTTPGISTRNHYLPYRLIAPLVHRDFECGDISNKLNVNRPGISGSEGDQRTVSAEYQLTESFSLRYNYGSTDNFQQVTRDSDFTNRVGSAANPLLSADAGVPFEDNVLGVTYDYTEESHELQRWPTWMPMAVGT